MLEGLKRHLKELVNSLFAKSPEYYCDPLEEKVREKVAADCDISKEQLPPVEYRPLPFIGVLSKYGYAIVGKIAGAYDAIKHKIYIDPRDYLSSNLYERIKLLAEEFYHAADRIKGKIKNKYKSLSDYLRNYHKDEDETRAKRYAERIASELTSYLSLYGL